MLKKEQLNVAMGLSDSELEFSQKNAEGLKLVLRCWNESRVTLHFPDAIRVLDNDLNGVASVWEVRGGSDFLSAAFARVYEDKVPSSHNYKHIQLLDADGVVALEVVCKGLEVYPSTK